MKHFLALRDYHKDELTHILNLAFTLKRELKQNIAHPKLAGKTLAMIFEKSSTRTRVSFETGIFQLGGVGLFLSSNDLQMGRGEPIRDTAAVLSRYVDGIMIRTFAHSTVEELARHSSVPVINGLSDLLHPCQAMADVMTMLEHSDKPLEEIKLAYVGDGNNVANSLIYGAASLGYSISIASPKGYEVADHVAQQASTIARSTGAPIHYTHDPAEAIRGADFVYTDVWASMGQEDQQQERLRAFEGFTVTEKLMQLGTPNCKFLHCLPAYRDKEVSAEVCDGPRSIIYDQAENRLHAQKAIMVHLMA
ncbi:ornithine carbamoyltransferase [Desulfurispirillum indicum]|uniref:Ornithine carbamoyltransferase n=1 Tax=Desulfurispirillum indicum (strain ATCC BAA-1389 / DSM 22839 / S5) TaxID=653733 RepID=E6W201_DESIS|nr:ornithine carbamoyltransferase [Desulfurispirillum indicum]ADU66627.1 ornithine carbamoyltransferase [Desulfurispirillum indicum S5]UCZ55944.1 ornithine carbamoyltransferase [Desulfurispirillum indicum]